MSEDQSYSRVVDEDVRLIILKELKAQRGRSNDTVLLRVVHDLGHSRKSRDYVRTQIRKLEELGAVTLITAGSVFVVDLTQTGLDHVQLQSTIEGVAVPSMVR